MNLLVVGSGDLGTELGLRAAAHGHRVHALRRRAELLPAPLLPIAAELPGAPVDLPDDIEVVVITIAADGRDEATYRRAYVDAPAQVLDALEATGAPLRRVVFTSSTAVYGVEDGSEVDEDTPTVPTRPTGAVLVDAEQALWERPVPTVSLRLAGVYGPGRERLLQQLRTGQAVRPEPDVHTNRIHRDDAADALLHLATMPQEPAACYLGVDDAPALLGDVLRHLAGELGVAVPPRGPVTRSRGGDKRCSNARLRASGWTPAYPSYHQGYRAVLAGHGVRHP